jgi:hypothetical protein
VAVLHLAGEVPSSPQRGFAKGWLLVSGILQEPTRPLGSQALRFNVGPGSTPAASQPFLPAVAA